MRKIFAIWITKILIIIGKLAGKKGSSTPGAIALKICPDIIEKLSSQVKGEIIAVCGTNGKTTTNNLIYSVLSSNGRNVVCNNVGANMLYGVTTAFISSASIFGKLDADYACIEIDEFSTVHVFPHMKPDYIVLTNLFRDQLDRFGEIDITMDCLSRAMKMVPDAKLILNGDDPLVTAFGMNTDNECIYFGVSENVGISLNETKEGRFCRFCGEELSYNYYHYSQLGDYYCPKCSFKRPEINYNAVNLNLDGGIAFDVKNTRINVNYRGFYNIYNILASFAVANELKIDLSNFNSVLSNYKPQIGRMEPYDIGKPVIFNLSKNPAGFNQALSTVIGDKRRKSIVVVINDNDQDGNDISWIWDVDFERFKDANANMLFASGIRHNDVCVRFKYAELADFTDVCDVKTAILKAKEDKSDVIYVLVNYTALFSTENILKELSSEGKK